MEQHPIPQDVTGFQFKLIGSMTVKQFGYVACGVILAVICYYIQIDNIFWIMAKILLIPLFAGSGVIIAFVPIDGRPIDVMASNFTKALFSPNQYVYRREGKKFSFNKITIAKQPVKTPAQVKAAAIAAAEAKKNDTNLEAKEARLRAFLQSTHGGIRNDLDKKEAAFLKTLTIAPSAPALRPTAGIAQAPRQVMPLAPAKPPQVAPRPIPAPMPVQQPPAPLAPVVAPVQQVPQQIPNPSTPKTTASPAAKEAALVQKETQLAQELSKAQQAEATSQSAPLHEAAHQKVLAVNKQIEEIHAQKQQLEQELAQLQTQLANQKGTPVVPALQTPAPPVPQAATVAQDPQHVRTIPQDVTKKVGLPHVSDTPNVVVGIVKDPRGNVLPNILVEVKDKDGNPVRAFKTNPLGQFASATPLSAGNYTIELEDPKKQNRFDVIALIANNQILPAMEVISHDAREDLRKQLFAS